MMQDRIEQPLAVQLWRMAQDLASDVGQDVDLASASAVRRVQMIHGGEHIYSNLTLSGGALR